MKKLITSVWLLSCRMLVHFLAVVCRVMYMVEAFRFAGKGIGAFMGGCYLSVGGDVLELIG